MPDGFGAVEALFHEALALAAHERAQFLDRACGGDPRLRAEVESLLAHHQAQPTTDFEEAIAPMVGSLFQREPAPDLPAGAMLGPYRIEAKVGEGGMGAVYRARDTRLDRDVAVKTLGGSLTATAETRARLLREARAAAALAHAHIAAVHDVGETGDVPWIVMEYVAGVPLRTRLLGSALPDSALRRYASQIASALEHAHARRIVHRDLKPDNILIAKDDAIKVVDFGLARPIAEDVAGAGAITEPATFVGTLAYSAPELFSGAAATARSDVYSFGVMLYEMASGEHPFRRLTGPRLVAAVLSGDYPRLEASGDSPSGALAGVIDRCMARVPAERYASGGELAAALRAALEGDAPDGAKRPPRVAILDFENLTGGDAGEWLGTGLAETLSADLAKIDAVAVANRSRVHQLHRRVGDPLQDAEAATALGDALSVRWIVAGTYQQAAGRVRVTPKIIDAHTGAVRAIDKVDGHRDDLFELQDRVAAAVLNALAIGISTTDHQKIGPVETQSLVAYEHYIRGRQHLYRMEAQSLTAAIRELQQAIALDGNYALACSALGTAHSLQFLRTSDPEDVVRSSAALEHAIQLDPELGEPYPWLSNVRLRRNDLRGALSAGARGVALQPDLPEAHYFHGGIHYMVAESPLCDPRAAPAALAESIRLEPRFHPAWIVLGATAMFLGAHDAAVQILSRALRLEAEPDLRYRFVGARTLLGIAHARAADWAAARPHLVESLESLKSSGHVYRDTFRTLAACTLGDIDLRCGAAATALTHYRHAHRIIAEAPRTAGSVRLQIRVASGLAAAYAATGDTGRARTLLAEAADLLPAVRNQTATVTFECGLAQIYLGLAVAALRIGDMEEAEGHLDRARETGWHDRVWLLADPELEPLRSRPAFTRFASELASRPAPVIEIPGFADGPGQSADA